VSGSVGDGDGGATGAAGRDGPATFAPAPGAAARPRTVAAQAAFELRLWLRNGEQLLLVLVIPTLLLVLLSTVEVVDTGPGEPVAFLAPGVLALAVMSTAFTGQAIATAYDRRYGALKWLGSTPLGRGALLAAKTCAVVAVEAVQVGVLVAAALALGWAPTGSLAAAALLLVLGTAAFSALGLLMAGTLRAEATLAAANLAWVVLLLTGDVVVPLDRFGAGAEAVLSLSPAAALATGLRDVLADGAGLPLGPVAVLVVWALAGGLLAARTFRWE
jgi:ABC-2 type transport system permease protein